MTYLIQHYFENSARRFPDKIAVSCENEKIGFSELDRFSNALARELLRRYEAWNRQLDRLPGSVRALCQALADELLPGDWPLWMELAREEAPRLH